MHHKGFAFIVPLIHVAFGFFPQVGAQLNEMGVGLKIYESSLEYKQTAPTNRKMITFRSPMEY